MTYLEPTLPVLLLLLVVFFAVRQRRREGVVIGALVLACWPPAAYLFELPLTFRYSAAPPASGSPGAIVVLSGYVAFPEDVRRRPQFGEDTARRLSSAIFLYEHWRPLPVYATGGKLGNSPISYGAAMKNELVRNGVPADAVRVEERSSNTFENAVNTVAQLKADGVGSVVLVTSSYHLLRAELCFRNQGIAVYPVSADLEPGWRIENLIPGWPSLRTVGRALHEYVALVSYWLRGRL